MDRAVCLAVWGVPVLLICVGSWYFWTLRWSQRRAREILGWIRLAFHQHDGRVEWKGLFRFQTRIEPTSGVFQNGLLVVQLLPSYMTVSWLWSPVRRREETLTFQADLDVPPSFELEVHNHRWCGNVRRRFAREARHWTAVKTGPVVMTTRLDWQPEIASMWNALLACRECNCSRVAFRRFPPHFSVTAPLETIAPYSKTHAEVFAVFRELAGSSWTMHF